MTEFQRFAIYYAPEPGPLADFGAAWLGWDAVQGRAVPHPEVAGLPLPVEEITRTPRKYGLHGTMKPPFRLAEGQSERTLRSTLAAFAGATPSVTLPRLTLARIGGFLALVPEGDQSALSDLAADTVRAFDAFRAPLTDTELARRRKSGLSDRQEALLCEWGYPYVMEEFRFHVTLTGSFARDHSDQVWATLAPHLAPLLPRPFTVSALCLFGEDGEGRFHLLHRYALTG